MVKVDPIKEVISVIMLVFILVAFIPIFQELGVNFSFMLLFILAIILIGIILIALWIKERFF